MIQPVNCVLKCHKTLTNQPTNQPTTSQQQATTFHMITSLWRRIRFKGSAKTDQAVFFHFQSDTTNRGVFSCLTQFHGGIWSHRNKPSRTAIYALIPRSQYKLKMQQQVNFSTKINKSLLAHLYLTKIQYNVQNIHSQI